MTETKKKRVRSRAEDTGALGPCVIKDCGQNATGRGLCKQHYSMAQSGLKAGRIPNWEWLIERGMAKATLRDNNPFTKKLEEEGVIKNETVR